MGMSALEVRRRVMLAQPHEAVASGAIASFVTDVKSPLPLEFDLEPIQSGSGDPSPDNIRPITGHDGFTRTGTGKNLWDGEMESGYYDVNNNGAKVDSATWKRSKNTIPCLPSTNIYFYNEGQATSGFGALLFFDMYGNQISYKTSGVKNSVVTTPANAKTMAFYAKEEWIGNISVNYPASDTAYHAYQGTSYHTTFPTPPGTVYGGHVKDNGDGTGTLVVDRGIVDLGALSWGLQSGHRFQAYNVIYAKPSNSYDVPANCLCSEYVTLTQNQVYSGKTGIAIHALNGRSIYVYDNRFDNATTFKSAMSGVQLVYELATPVTYTLSLTALQSLIGQNHVWVDNADSVTVEYWGH